MSDDFDRITQTRKALFDAGGIHLEIKQGKGQMIPNSPEFQARADAYNALAAAHVNLYLPPEYIQRLIDAGEFSAR